MRERERDETRERLKKLKVADKPPAETGCTSRKLKIP